MYIIDVLVEHPVYRLDSTFSYLYHEALPVGIRVRISFRKRQIIGYVMSARYTDLTKAELEAQDGFTYQMINEIIDDTPLLNDELRSLGETLAKLTLSPRIACYQTMLPGALKPKSRQIVTKKTQKALRILREGMPKTATQKKLYEELKREGPHFLKDLSYSRAPIDGLIAQGLIEVYDQEVLRDPYEENVSYAQVTLTEDQTRVVGGILNETHEISLLHGVTGSGKTEVYLALTKEMLRSGKNVIMLVPEISLTPMMVRQFKSRFHEDVAILHSRLSEGEKYDEYRRIANGQVRIVVGARSAVFAPLANIGLIIMDEEHDSSYKQDNNPRYHTLQVAKLRAKYHHARIVLGSATPLLESYARAKKGVYALYELPRRINRRPLPQVSIVDMAKEAKHGHYGMLSLAMLKRIQETIDRHEQVLLLLNKRGYASFIKCEDCGHILMCPHCDVSLTYHKSEDMLKCHHCQFTMPVPVQCPECQGQHLKKIGYGTQKIEEYLMAHIEGAKIIRYDHDTTRHKNVHSRLLDAFAHHEANIMIGTQMIAKGLDFPDVTFVGVVMADLGLTIPDFRASERTFQLLTQVAGRSGRSEKQGTVMIQTYNPDHYAIVSAAAQDYQIFYEKEMAYRHHGAYPPFCHLVSVIISSQNETHVHQEALHIKNFLQKELPAVRIVGPGMSTLYKLKDVYRERLLIKYIESKDVYRALHTILDYYNKEKSGRVQISCDFNPYTTL